MQTYEILAREVNLAECAVTVVLVDGGILAQGTSKATVSVYNAAGQLVAKGVTNKVISATAGLYLVKVDNQTRKILVK